MKRKIIALLFLLVGCTFLNAAPYSEKIKELLVRLDSLIAQKTRLLCLKRRRLLSCTSFKGCAYFGGEILAE